AGTVRAHDAHALAAQDARGQPFEHHAAVEGYAGILGLEHQLAGGGGLLHGHAGLADALAARAALLAHRHQRAHPAFVARAAGLHAFPDPRLFLRQTLVEQRMGARLVGELRRLARRVRAVVAGPARQPAAVEVDDARGHAVDEAPVVADEQQRAAETLQ